MCVVSAVRSNPSVEPNREQHENLYSYLVSKTARTQTETIVIYDQLCKDRLGYLFSQDLQSFTNRLLFWESDMRETFDKEMAPSKISNIILFLTYFKFILLSILK